MRIVAPFSWDVRDRVPETPQEGKRRLVVGRYTDRISTDIMHVTPCMQDTEETIAKYAVDANLFRLGSTNPKKNIQPLDFFFSILKKKLKKYFFQDWWTLVGIG